MKGTKLIDILKNGKYYMTYNFGDNEIYKEYNSITIYDEILNHNYKNVLLIDQGKRVEERNCPIEKTKKCIHCKPMCNITCGFSGAGAFSDGKLSLYNPKDDDIHVGGNLHKYIGVPKTKELIDYTDKIYLEFGADPHVEGLGNTEEIKDIRKRAIQAGLKLVDCPIRHLGTEKAHQLVFERNEELRASGITLARTAAAQLAVDAA